MVKPPVLNVKLDRNARVNADYGYFVNNGNYDNSKPALEWLMSLDIPMLLCNLKVALGNFSFSVGADPDTGTYYIGVVGEKKGVFGYHATYEVRKSDDGDVGPVLIDHTGTMKVRTGDLTEEDTSEYIWRVLTYLSHHLETCKKYGHKPYLVEKLFKRVKGHSRKKSKDHGEKIIFSKGRPDKYKIIKEL